MNVRTEFPTPENASNFNCVADSQTEVGSTLDNLKAAVTGETGASAKYTAYAEAADAAGFSQIARLFTEYSGKMNEETLLVSCPYFRTNLLT